MQGEEPSNSTVAAPADWGAGGRQELLDQLRWMAVSQFSAEQAGHTLQPTAVVHEAWLRIAAKVDGSLDTEAAFRQWAGKIVRQVLVDHARKRHAGMRDVRRRSPLVDRPSGGGMTPDELLVLSDLLDQLAIAQPRMASVIEMRYFGGMKDADIALRLGVTDRTVRKDWAFARAWLFGRLTAD